MSARVSQEVIYALRLVAAGHTAYKAAQLAGVHRSSVLRAIKRRNAKDAATATTTLQAWGLPL